MDYIYGDISKKVASSQYEGGTTNTVSVSIENNRIFARLIPQFKIPDDIGKVLSIGEDGKLCWVER